MDLRPTGYYKFAPNIEPSCYNSSLDHFFPGILLVWRSRELPTSVKEGMGLDSWNIPKVGLQILNSISDFSTKLSHNIK